MFYVYFLVVHCQLYILCLWQVCQHFFIFLSLLSVDAHTYYKP